MLDAVEAIGDRHQPRDAVGHLRDIAQQGADEALQDHDAMRRETACARFDGPTGKYSLFFTPVFDAVTIFVFKK